MDFTRYTDDPNKRLFLESQWLIVCGEIKAEPSERIAANKLIAAILGWTKEQPKQNEHTTQFASLADLYKSHER